MTQLLQFLQHILPEGNNHCRIGICNASANQWGLVSLLKNVGSAWLIVVCDRSHFVMVVDGGGNTAKE
jgi:hypothetical protein